MDPSRNFILKKGTFLTCVSYKNMISDPLLNLYFTSPAEAVFALFRDATVAPFELSIGQTLSTTSQRTNELDDLYLNTFYLNEDLLINPLPDSNLERELRSDPNLAEVRDAIQADCQSSARDGFVIPYLPSLYYEQGQQNRRPVQIIGRITTYVLCRQNLLLHTQSFRILKEVLVTDLQQLVTARAAENPQQRLTGGAIVDVLTRYLRENRGRVLEEVYIQPEVSGLTSSPVSLEIPPTLPLPITDETPIVPPSSMLSPKDPSIFIPQQLSPGGTTVYDAFATVPTDIVRVMALNMTLDALSNTCQTSQRFNQAICNSNEFWALRAEQDFGRRNDETDTIMQRKPETWSWKRYYAELSGNLPPNQILAFADLDLELLTEIDALPREAYEARVNEMRREAGLGAIDFERPEYQAARKVPQQQPNVRRQLFPQPMVGPRVMGPVVENPNVGLMGEFPNRPRVGFNMDFDGDAVPMQGRIIRGGGRLNVNQADMERIREFIVAPAPVPANPADIRRLFASQEDYQDFFERYNPQPDIRQRAIPIRAGDEIPLHLNAAFEHYRNLIVVVRGGQLIAGNVRNEIFGQLFERAALIGADPANVLHQQILDIEQFMPDADLWPQQSRQILMQQFEVYVAEQRMNAQIQQAPAVGVPAAANLAPPGDLIDLHRLYANLIRNFDQPQEVQQPGIEAFLRSLDLRRAQRQWQSQHDQFIDDMRDFEQYPRLVDDLTPAQTARIQHWLQRLDEAQRGVPLNIQQAQGRVFRNPDRQVDRIDVPGGLLQGQQAIAAPQGILDIHRLYVNIMGTFGQPYNQAHNQLMIALLQNLDARRGQQSRVEQFDQDLRNFDQYPRLGDQIRPLDGARLRGIIIAQNNGDQLPEEQIPEWLQETEILYRRLLDTNAPDYPERIFEIVRNIDQRRGNQSRREQLQTDIVTILRYPVLAENWPLVNVGQLRRILANVEQIGINPAFRPARDGADRLDVPGGLLRRQEPAIPIIPVEIRQRFYLYSALSEAIQAEDRQRAVESARVVRRDVNPRARANGISPPNQIRVDLAGFQRYPLLIAGWSAKAREDLINYLTEAYERQRPVLDP